MCFVASFATAALSFAINLVLFQSISALLRPAWFQATQDGDRNNKVLLDSANKIVSSIFAVFAVAVGAKGEI